MNKKTTKRSLLASVMALVLCVIMLVGTTFAWFTDTASTSVNKIVSGKLDVALEMQVGEEWVNAEGQTLQFKKAGDAAEQVLWEPGCRYELPKLRVVNNGNLALKYKVAITGITGDAKLNEVIDWTIGDVALGTEQQLPAGANNEFTIKGVMQTTAGNEYQNLSIDGIGITVYATQDAVESDSFDRTYDADAPIVYPEGIDTGSFADATTVLYSKTFGAFSIGIATSEEDLARHPAVLAYLKDGEVKYAADMRVALEDGAMVLYCKENAEIPMAYAHVNVLNDLTVYGNGAKFSGGDLAITASGINGFVAPANLETTINIYNAKNLGVWGEPQQDNRVWNVNYTDCQSDGVLMLMYRGDKNKTAEINLTMTNCIATGFVDSIVHTSADGSMVIKNCVFMNNCAPINISHKQAGAMNITVEDCKFINCGKVNPTNDYFAPVRFVNNSTIGALNVTLTNNVFTDTIGTNGDILLGDYRETGKSNPFTTQITTSAPVMVKSSTDAAYSFGGGSVTVAAY